MESQIIKFIEFKTNIKKLFRTIFLTIALWLSAFALQEIDPTNISDSLLNYIYYEGRQTQRISYDQIKNNTKTNGSGFQTNIQNYYKNYKEDGKDENNKNITNNKTINEKLIFNKKLMNTYGNHTMFNINLNDLELIVAHSVLDDVQTVLVWESLLHMKTDRMKDLYGKSDVAPDKEIYLFNVFPLKAIGMFLFFLIIFMVVHNIQIYLLKENGTTLAYNCFSVPFAFLNAFILYNWEYYAASCLMLMLMFLGFKFFLDSMLMSLGNNKEDLEIFVSITCTQNMTQFYLKFTIFSLMAIFIGLNVILKFRYFLNYIVFYLCLLQTLNLTSFSLQYEVPHIFQPLKHFLIIGAGVINFLLTKFHGGIGPNVKIEKYDSFYILSDCFSFLCMTFIFDYLFTQVNNIAYLFYENNVNNDSLNAQIAEIVNNYKDHQKSFYFDDCLWFVVFIWGYIVNFAGLYFANYFSFYFSFHFFKLVFKAFGKVYQVRIMRLFYNFLLFSLILLNHLMSLKVDNGFFEVNKN
jgi:hypothetical protein